MTILLLIIHERIHSHIVFLVGLKKWMKVVIRPHFNLLWTCLRYLFICLNCFREFLPTGFICIFQSGGFRVPVADDYDEFSSSSEEEIDAEGPASAPAVPDPSDTGNFLLLT